jgi:hypothetical protein
MFFQEYVINHDGSARMDEANSSNKSIHVQDKMLDQEKEASVTMTATPKRLQALLSQQGERNKKDDETNNQWLAKQLQYQDCPSTEEYQTARNCGEMNRIDQPSTKVINFTIKNVFMSPSRRERQSHGMRDTK